MRSIRQSMLVSILLITAFAALPIAYRHLLNKRPAPPWQDGTGSVTDAFTSQQP